MATDKQSAALIEAVERHLSERRDYEQTMAAQQARYEERLEALTLEVQNLRAENRRLSGLISRETKRAELYEALTTEQEGTLSRLSDTSALGILLGMSVSALLSILAVSGSVPLWVPLAALAGTLLVAKMGGWTRENSTAQSRAESEE